MKKFKRVRTATVGATMWLCLISIQSVVAQVNPIVVENSRQGNPSSQWQISGAGDTNIQGFATDISVNRGETVHFKIRTDATAYRIDIYRLGYYRGLGARLIASISPSAALPQSQPNPITDSTTGLIDYGTWAESASWPVPTNATSGIYIAKLVRLDTAGTSHIVFIVRDDSRSSDILFKTSDASWQAYNDYGGNNLYGGNGPGGGISGVGRAYKVSYNRPFNTRSKSIYDWLFNAEYPMIRWLEASGYDVSYTTSVDVDRRGASLLQHRLFLSVGHDEYWSAAERANVETARDEGVNLAFFSGNEMFWKTRWEPSIDGSATPYRTLVCYKETHAGAKIDPTPIWTGTWRDPRFSPPADGGRPENELSGTLFMVNGPVNDSIQVPASYGVFRFWRNTSIATLAPGATAILPAGTLGYEWDEVIDNGFLPPGLIRMSLATFNENSILRDYGSIYTMGVATHSLTLYRHPSGALVFGAGTIQWSWGLDRVHDIIGMNPTQAMQQATVNLFADMGIQPATLQTGLIAASPSSDIVAPMSSIVSPQSDTSVLIGTPTRITGTAGDVDGHVGGVEVSTDGGTTWHPALGWTNWSYTWLTLRAGPATILSRAVDDSGNLESPTAGVSITVSSVPGTIWPNTVTPILADSGPDGAVELGVKFKSDVAGLITDIHFYKASANTGTHIGHLWTSAGALLASVTFTNETASGWQQATFGTPVAIDSNTVYVASYHANNGHYSADLNYFLTGGVDNPPLHALANGVSGGNGVYTYANGVCPAQTYNAANYWVDVAFATNRTLTNITVTPVNPTITGGTLQQFTATGTYSDGSTQNITSQATWTSSSSGVATINALGLATGATAGATTISTALAGLTNTTVLTVLSSPLVIDTISLPIGLTNVMYLATLTASGGTAPYTWSLAGGSLPTGLTLNSISGAITGTPTATGIVNFTVQVSDVGNPVQITNETLSIVIASTPPTVSNIWPSDAAPVRVDGGADRAVELGVKFESDVAGLITGIRFYKASANTGTHIGHLWTSAGALLASVTFTNETPSGWQQAIFGMPVAIASNTVYVVSYHANNGHYSADLNYFLASGVDNPPLHAPANGVSGGNGVYTYASGVCPAQTYNAANYWVDVAFATNRTLTNITVTPVNPTITGGTSQQFTATGTYSDGSTQDVTSQATWTSSSSGVATINALGLATGATAGATTISAALAGLTNTTVLTVLPSPLVINTISLPIGLTNAIYLATLTASGGTAPYTWSLAGGSLPTGLTLNSINGAITGTPTATGIVNFTVQVSDVGNPVQITNEALNIVILSTPPAVTNIWPSGASPVRVDGGADRAVELGVKFESDIAGLIAGIRFYKASANTGTHIGRLWTGAGALLASVTFTNETASGWQQAIFGTPVAIDSNTVYVASYHANNGHYSADLNYFLANGVDNPPLHALANGVSGGNGVYTYANGVCPTQTYNAANYWVDIVFQATTGPAIATLLALTQPPMKPSVFFPRDQSD